MDEKEHQRLHDQGVPHDHSGQGITMDIPTVISRPRRY